MRCKVCKEESPNRGSLAGLVHKWGPVDHQFDAEATPGAGRMGRMSQPKWKFIANLGDVNPLEHGGVFVYEDKTGAYAPEMEVLEFDEGYWRAFRIVLDKPSNDEWFMDSIPKVEKCCDHPNLIDDLRSDSPIKRALAYRDLAYYFGEFEFDQYPLEHLTRTDVRRRYRKGELG